MIVPILITLTSTTLGLSQNPARSTRRTIDRCAQDGTFFYGIDDSSSSPGNRPQPKPVIVSRNGVTVKINYSPNETRLSLAHAGHMRSVTVKDIEPTLTFLTVGTAGFALSTSDNAHDWSTQLFLYDSNSDILPDTSLVSTAENSFRRDASRYCRNPGQETSAIKWIDGSHLLLAIDAWVDGFCSSTFTEGFILDVRAKRIKRKLSEQELVNLPTVCTSKVVPQ
jgi:hypothetical protein